MGSGPARSSTQSRTVSRRRALIYNRPVSTRMVLPELEDLFVRQAKELDRKQRERLLNQIQKPVADHMLVAPLFQQAFIWGVGSRVAEGGAGLIEGYPYAAPCEDLKLH